MLWRRMGGFPIVVGLTSFRRRGVFRLRGFLLYVLMRLRERRGGRGVVGEDAVDEAA